MPTRRLFDEDSHLCDFEARIVAVRPEGPWIALDATAFFPEDGGQPSDRGMLAGEPVVELATDEEGVIWHRLAKPIDAQVGAIIEGRVDDAARRDHRQQHTGQHILSRAWQVIHGAETRGFHIGAEVSTIDLSIDAIDFDRIRAVEALANAIVFEDRLVSVTTEDRPGAPPLRTVAIQDLEEQHCCGTHVRTTGEIGIIKMLRWEKIRGLIRVQFVCGGRALHLFGSLIEAVDAAARPFSAGWLDLPRAVEGALEEARSQTARARDWQKRWAPLEAERLSRDTARDADGVLVVRAWIDGADADGLRALATAIDAHAPAIVLLAGSGADGRRAWLVSRSKDLPPARDLDARALLTAVLEPLGGRGGGQKLFAQGSCPADEAACRATLQTAGV
jgi:alanyl-tRNA synthetase